MSGIILAFAETIHDQDQLMHSLPLYQNNAEFPSLPTRTTLEADWELVQEDEEDILSCNSTVFVAGRTYAEAAILGGVEHNPIPLKQNVSNHTCRKRVHTTSDTILNDEEEANLWYRAKRTGYSKQHTSDKIRRRRKKAYETRYRRITYDYTIKNPPTIRSIKHDLEDAQKYLDKCKDIYDRVPKHYYVQGTSLSYKGEDGQWHFQKPCSRYYFKIMLSQNIADLIDDDPLIKRIILDAVIFYSKKGWLETLDDCEITLWSVKKYITNYYHRIPDIHTYLYFNIIYEYEKVVIPQLKDRYQKERIAFLKALANALPLAKDKFFYKTSRMQYARYVLCELDK